MDDAQAVAAKPVYEPCRHPSPEPWYIPEFSWCDDCWHIISREPDEHGVLRWVCHT